MSEQQDLKQLAEEALRLAEAATPGEWKIDRQNAEDREVIYVDHTRDYMGNPVGIARTYQIVGDGRFIAFSRSALPALARGYLDLRELNLKYQMQLDQVLLDLEARRELAQRLREALAYYADRKNYGEDGEPGHTNSDQEWDWDLGAVAREALAAAPGTQPSVSDEMVAMQMETLKSAPEGGRQAVTTYKPLTDYELFAYTAHDPRPSWEVIDRMGEQCRRANRLAAVLMKTEVALGAATMVALAAYEGNPSGHLGEAGEEPTDV